MPLIRKLEPGPWEVGSHIKDGIVLDGSNTHGQDELRQKYVVKDKLWLWGLNPDEVSGFLDQYGWRILDHSSYEELAKRYITSANRDLASLPIERMVYAEKV